MRHLCCLIVFATQSHCVTKCCPGSNANFLQATCTVSEGGPRGSRARPRRRTAAGPRAAPAGPRRATPAPSGPCPGARSRAPPKPDTSGRAESTTTARSRAAPHKAPSKPIAARTLALRRGVPWPWPPRHPRHPRPSPSPAAPRSPSRSRATPVGKVIAAIMDVRPGTTLACSASDPILTDKHLLICSMSNP